MHNQRFKRGTSFFVIDSFIAGMIILTAVMTIFTTFSSTSNTERPLKVVQDTIEYLRTTQVRDFNGNYTTTLVKQGNISDPTTTIFSQIAHFHRRNKTILANGVLAEVLNVTLPVHYNIAYTYNTTQLYKRTNTDMDSADTVLTVQRTSTVIYNGTNIYGPHPVKVKIWT